MRSSQSAPFPKKADTIKQEKVGARLLGWAHLFLCLIPQLQKMPMDRDCSEPSATEFSIMPIDSPQPLSKANEDSGFAQVAFDELQYAYPKDPARFARMYRDLKSDADNALGCEEGAADSCQKLCLLDLAVANLKANSDDHQSASVMYKNAILYLDKLKSIPGAANTQSIDVIAKKVKDKI